jgi:predicted nucleotidyltransferase
VPPANYFSLNRDHRLVGAILVALAAEEDIDKELLRFVLDELRSAGAVAVRLFGSAARKEMRQDSDVDLALVAEVGRKAELEAAAATLYEPIWNQFGVRASFLVGEKTVEAMAQAEESEVGVWHRIEAEGVEVI